MAKKRYKFIVNIRAVTILLVVFGHSIILYSDAWNIYQTSFNIPILNFIKQWINLIQMPIFFSLSGFLFFDDSNKLLALAKKKIVRLIFPYILFAILWLYPIRKAIGYYPVSKGVLDFILEDIILENDIGHLWYLPCLFFCFVIYHVLNKAGCYFLNGIRKYRSNRASISRVKSNNYIESTRIFATSDGNCSWELMRHGGYYGLWHLLF